MLPSDSNGITAKSHKRSSIPGDMLDTDEAADLLGIKARRVRDYISGGFLKATKDVRGNRLLVSLQDLAALASTLVTGLDFASVARISVRALISAGRAEKRLEALEAVLGIDGVALKGDEESVLSTYHQCKDLIAEYTEDLSAPDVMDWAYLLAAVTEEYLDAVTLYTGDQEPWDVFMTAAAKLHDAAPRERFSYRKDLEIAYGYVGMVRRQLRQVAYFYIRRKYGADVAAKAFPETSMSGRDVKVVQIALAMKTKTTH